MVNPITSFVLLVVSLVLPSLFSTTDPAENIKYILPNRFRRQTTSCEPPTKFLCDNNKCINQNSTCDGTKDCSDGSDETNTLCNQTSSDPFTSGGCRLPPHPLNGAYVSTQCEVGDLRAGCRNTPGTAVPSNWLLRYTCNEGYDLTSLDAHEFSICYNGVWRNPLECIRLCPPLKSLSVDVRCWFGGREVTCNRPMKPNTTATAKCKQHYTEAYVPEYSSLNCLGSGDWNYRLFRCTPECGISTEPGSLETLILNGHLSRIGEFPWLASLFHLNASQQWEQNCAGTLITPHIVLTAAHCLKTNTGVVTKAEDVAVGLGKYYRDFYNYERYASVIDVREVVIPELYAGIASYYAVDIALLDLAVTAKLTAIIMPACVDWQSSFHLTPGEIGHVGGWGTTENGIASETRLSTKLKYINNTDCINQVRQLRKVMVTHDKFCAGVIDGSSGQVDHGDSGGGLTFVRRGLHFVYGIVSTKIKDEEDIALFTDLLNVQHINWLENKKKYLNTFHQEN